MLGWRVFKAASNETVHLLRVKASESLSLVLRWGEDWSSFLSM